MKLLSFDFSFLVVFLILFLHYTVISMSDKFPKLKSFITFAAMKRFMKETADLLVSSEAVEELIEELEVIAKKRTQDAARITKTFKRKTITKEVMKTIRENSK